MRWKPETTIEVLEEISLDDNDPYKKVLVDTLLTKEEESEMICFLRENKTYLLGPSVMEHRLNNDPSYPPV